VERGEVSPVCGRAGEAVGSREDSGSPHCVGTTMLQCPARPAAVVVSAQRAPLERCRETQPTDATAEPSRRYSADNTEVSGISPSSVLLAPLLQPGECVHNRVWACVAERDGRATRLLGPYVDSWDSSQNLLLHLHPQRLLAAPHRVSPTHCAGRLLAASSRRGGHQSLDLHTPCASCYKRVCFTSFTSARLHPFGG
jgi:hypothetical protein